MKQEIKKELGAGRVAFLARLPAIKEGIEAGRTVMSMYREVGSQLGIGYSQFDRYVNKYIRPKAVEVIATNEPRKKKELSTIEIFDSPMDKKDIF